MPAEFVTGRSADGRPQVSHAWARTIDGVQGGTWDQVHLLATPALDRYRGYVGQSRSIAPTHTWNTTRQPRRRRPRRTAGQRTAAPRPSRSPPPWPEPNPKPSPPSTTPTASTPTCGPNKTAIEPTCTSVPPTSPTASPTPTPPSRPASATWPTGSNAWATGKTSRPPPPVYAA